METKLEIKEEEVDLVKELTSNTADLLNKKSNAIKGGFTKKGGRKKSNTVAKKKGGSWAANKTVLADRGQGSKPHTSLPINNSSVPNEEPMFAQVTTKKEGTGRNTEEQPRVLF